MRLHIYTQNTWYILILHIDAVTTFPTDQGALVGRGNDLYSHNVG